MLEEIFHFRLFTQRHIFNYNKAGLQKMHFLALFNLKFTYISFANYFYIKDLETMHSNVKLK